MSSVTMHSEIECREMHDISTSPVLLSVLFFQTFFSLVSEPLLIAAICIVNKMALIHFNTKIILFAFIAALMVHSLSRIVLHTTDLITYLSPHDSLCSLLPSVIRCFFMRVPMNYSIYFACTSTFIVALERLVSTLKAKNYEKNRYVSFVLLVLQVVVAAALFAVMYSNVQLDENREYYYCHATSVDKPFLTIGPFSALIILQFSAMFILKLLQRLNKHRSDEQRLKPDLRVRYNVGENLRTIAIVIPFCYASCVFSSIFLAVMCLIMFANHLFSKAVYYALVDGSMLLPVYSLVLPLLLKRMNKRVIEKSNTEFQRHYSSANGKLATSVYFDSLSWAWNNKNNRKLGKIPIPLLKNKSSRTV